MIRWTVPSALAGLVLLAGPILVHMLVRRHARRVIFPTTRFLQRTQAAAVRFRRPSDVGLLLLRLAIVLAAVLAAAQPVWLAGWRTARWDRRVARAVVLDTSPSVAASPEAQQLAAQELQAFASATFAGQDLRDEIRRAAEWLRRTPPARREVVIVSDFQRGAIDARALRSLPRDAGVRFVRARQTPGNREVPLPPVSGWRGAVWTAAAMLRGDRLDVTWSRGGSAAPPAWLTTAQRPGEEDAAARALAAAVSSGVPPGPPGADRQHAVVVFAGAASRNGETAIGTPWMLRAAAALSRSDLIREAGADVRPMEQQGALVVHTGASAASAPAAAVIRAVMLAIRTPAVADTELETVTLTDSQLAAWRREPGPVTTMTSPLSDGTDARWLWGLALLLLGAESWLRRQRARAPQAMKARAHAA